MKYFMWCRSNGEWSSDTQETSPSPVTAQLNSTGCGSPQLLLWTMDDADGDAQSENPSHCGGASGSHNNWRLTANSKQEVTWTRRPQSPQSNTRVGDRASSQLGKKSSPHQWLLGIGESRTVKLAASFGAVSGKSIYRYHPPILTTFNAQFLML